MKKKLFGILTLSSVLALASCGTQSNEKTGENTADRGTFITVCEKVLDTLVDKETNLASFDIKEEDYDVLDDDKELTLVKTLVYFVELLYKNDNYPVTVKPVYSKANYVRDGKLPKGKKQQGFKELSWSLGDLQTFKNKQNDNSINFSDRDSDQSSWPWEV